MTRYSRFCSLKVGSRWKMIFLLAVTGGGFFTGSKKQKSTGNKMLPAALHQTAAIFTKSLEVLLFFVVVFKEQIRMDMVLSVFDLNLDIGGLPLQKFSIIVSFDLFLTRY